MSSGLPDWILALNVDGQQDGYFSVRPTYGAADTAFHSDTIGASATTLLLSVSGVGVIYGGFVMLTVSQTHKTNSLRLDVDGNQFPSGTFQFNNNGQLTKEYNNIFSLVKYDDVNFWYSFGISRGFTFETDVKLYYVNNVADAIFVDARLNFALKS